MLLILLFGWFGVSFGEAAQAGQVEGTAADGHRAVRVAGLFARVPPDLPAAERALVGHRYRLSSARASSAALRASSRWSSSSGLYSWYSVTASSVCSHWQPRIGQSP